MTLADIYTLLKTTKYPVAYRSFPVGTVLKAPYICYLEAYSNNFGADNVVYQPVKHIQIELYTAGKDETAEATVEKALADFYWDKTETYLDNEKIYQIIYEIEV